MTTAFHSYHEQVPFAEFEPVPERSLSIELLQDSEATVAHVTLTRYTGEAPGFDQTPGTGSAWRTRGDKPDRAIGEALAIARALDVISARLKREARGRMSQNDHVKRHRKEARERRESLRKYRRLSREVAEGGFSFKRQDYPPEGVDA